MSNNNHYSPKGMYRFSLFLFCSRFFKNIYGNCRTTAWVVVLVCAAICSSCSSLKFWGSPHKEWSTPEEVIDAYNENYNRINTLTGEGLISVQSEKYNQSGTIYVTIKKPDSLKVVLEGPLGVDIASFFMDKNEFLLYLPREELVFSGGLDTLNVRQMLYDLTELQLSDETIESQDVFKEIFGFFLGMSPLEKEDMISVNFADSARKSTIFKTQGLHSEIIYEFPSDRELLQKIQIMDETQSIRAERSFSRYAKSKGAHTPKGIKYKFFQETVQISLQYTGIRINKSIKADEFHIDIPPELKGIRHFVGGKLH